MKYANKTEYEKRIKRVFWKLCRVKKSYRRQPLINKIEKLINSGNYPGYQN